MSFCDTGAAPMIRDFSAVSYGAFYRTLWRMNEAHDLRRSAPASNDNR
jgi:hypothetical protein